MYVFSFNQYHITIHGAVLLQEGLSCACASKSLSATQMRYAQIEKKFLAICFGLTRFHKYIFGKKVIAQIEKELLAICFGLTRFHEYIFGKKVIVETDHQPLIPIFKKPLNKCPARLQRMLLQIQKYDIEVRYKRGKELVIADALSRAYLNEDDDHFDIEINAQVCLIKSYVNVSDEKLKVMLTYQTRN
ncbi:RNase H-like domain found in reverse transcriptase [Popillia japonica]|uniref:RNase H-like domain found in reverse transcriptase n=1 Tax=Popillia japonica TaxID=7064 RepID=A0AAW1K1C5_POPJA